MGIFLDYTLLWTPGCRTFFANPPCLYPYYLIFLVSTSLLPLASDLPSSSLVATYIVDLACEDCKYCSSHHEWFDDHIAKVVQDKYGKYSWAPHHIELR